MQRPALRPTPCSRASCNITASLTGKTAPARSRALLYDGQSVMLDFCFPESTLSEVIRSCDRPGRGFALRILPARCGHFALRPADTIGPPVQRLATEPLIRRPI